MKTFTIIYGITEGPWHGCKMRQILQERGWKPADSIEKADLIIAHSGGVFFVPKLRPEQKALLIDPTCIANRPSLGHVLRFIGWEVRHMILTLQFPSWFWRMLHNVYYGLAEWRRTREMSRRAYATSLEQIVQHPQTVITQSDNRAWFDESALHSLAGDHPLKLTFIQAGHDDCWDHPERYITLVQ